MARIRTFLAIDLGKSIRENLVHLKEDLGPLLPEVNWVEPESIHLTLLFLGEVNDRELLPVCRATQKAAQKTPSFTLSLAGMGCFPNLRRPRVLWIDIDKGRDALIGLHAELETPLMELGCYRREERLYTPHVTLGRLKSDPPDGTLSELVGKYQDHRAGQVEVKELLVMSSEMKSSGPVYTVMSRAKLAGRG